MEHFAIFASGDFGATGRLDYVTEAKEEEKAFEAFSSDLLSDTGEEAGWTWHVYQIPEEISDDNNKIYDYVEDRSPVTITS